MTAGSHGRSPGRLTFGSTGFQRSNGIVLSTGELIMPAYTYSYAVPKDERHAYAGVARAVRSSDGGQTWKRYGSVRGDEPTIVELRDSPLLMYLRTIGRPRPEEHFAR